MSQPGYYGAPAGAPPPYNPSYGAPQPQGQVQYVAAPPQYAQGGQPVQYGAPMQQQQPVMMQMQPVQMQPMQMQMQPMYAAGPAPGSPTHAYAPAPVQAQPVVLVNNPSQGAAVIGMSAPDAPPGTPPGLEYLYPLDRLLVYQQMNVLEVVTNWTSKQKYSVVNNVGGQVYFAVEDSGCCERQCLQNARSFKLNLTDPAGRLALRLESESCRCTTSWCFILPINCCCLQEMRVMDSSGQLIGRIVQSWGFDVTYDLVGPGGEKLLKIVGSMCPACVCCSDSIFHIYGPSSTSSQDVPIGQVARKWKGVLKETFLPGQADTYDLVFPQNLAIPAKALLLAFSFLMDLAFFENKNQHNHNNRHHHHH